MINKHPLPTNQAYTDLTQLQTLKAKSHKDDPRALEVAVRQFESLFVSMMLKGMRQANEAFSKGNFLNSDQTRFYQDMYDSQLSVTLSEQGGLGLTQVLMRQLGGNNVPQSPSGSVGRQDFADLQDYWRNPQQAELARQARESLGQVDELVERLGFANGLYGEGQDVPKPSGGKAVSQPDPIVFHSPEEFVAQLYPIAKQVGDELGVDPKVLLAQSALETGWGKHVMPRGGGSSYNLFGIKADQRWKGEVTVVSTVEYRGGVPLREKASFRAYPSYEESFRDYLDFLRNNPRYANALEQVGDSEAFVAELQQAGYATDPNYSDKITRIMQGQRLQAALRQNGG